MLGSGALLRVVIAALQDEIAYISLAVDPRHKRGQLLSHLVWLRDLSSDHLPQQDSQAEDIDLHGTEYHDLNLLPGLPLSLRAGTHQRPRITRHSFWLVLHFVQGVSSNHKCADSLTVQYSL